MRKKDKKTEGYGKLLEAWEKPEQAGTAIGCLATTFTFNPVFFEEECLSRFLAMESDAAQDGPVYLIEREEKLSQVITCAALVDQHHCRGSRNLRWDLLSARLRGGLLHAKISLLCWSDYVRVIISSANLTEDGYRKNQEVFGVLDYFEGTQLPLSCLRQIADFLKDVVSYSYADSREPSPAAVRWNQLLEWLRKSASSWGLEDSDRAFRYNDVKMILTGKNRPNMFDQLKTIWPQSSPPYHADVVSPFFDPPTATNAPALALWNILSKRGKAFVAYHVTAEEELGTDSLFVHAPASLKYAEPMGRAETETSFCRIDDSERPLHMKALWLEGNRWSVYMIGSSNFTSAGTGIGRHPSLEANLAYRVDHHHDKNLRKQMLKCFIESKELDLDQIEIRWQPKADEDEPNNATLVLPGFFEQAIYDVTANKESYIRLVFMSDPPVAWTIFCEDEKTPLCNDSDWLKQGRPSKWELPWTQPVPPSGFWVQLREGKVWWPVNISHPSVMPPPEMLRDLPLEVLVDILTSARPLHRVPALQRYLKQRKIISDLNPVSVIDPHKRVDTSQFLLRRTRRISWALNAIRQRLERPVPSIECLHWRLEGPVGVQAVANAIQKEGKSDEEKAFILTELALEVKRSQPQSAPGCLPRSVVERQLKEKVSQLQKQILDFSLSEPKNLNQYIQDVFEVALK